MKILISEAQYETLMRELDNHPELHDVIQRKKRMEMLESGIDLLLEYHPVKEVKGVGLIPQNLEYKIVGKYILTKDVADEINSRINKIYEYDFPKNESFSVLIYDFELNSPVVRTEKINFVEGKQGEKNKNILVKAFQFKKSKANLGFTNYEPVSKNDPDSPKSSWFTANSLALVFRNNVAQTIFFTKKSQWAENQARVNHVIGFDEFENYVVKKDEPSFVVSPMAKLRETVKETWILDWLENAK